MSFSLVTRSRPVACSQGQIVNCSCDICGGRLLTINLEHGQATVTAARCTRPCDFATRDKIMPVPQSSQTWQRSSFVGITPLTVKPRLGKKLVTKTDLILKPKNAVLSSLPSTAGTSIMAPPAAGGVERVCSVCTRRSAGYSCPRCLIAYCSSKCYKVGAMKETSNFVLLVVYLLPTREKSAAVDGYSQQNDPKISNQR